MITQRDFKDCGVTCMEYIIKFYHGYIPIEKLREDPFTNQEGTTAFHIVEAFKKYNFDSFGKKITFEDLNNRFLPAIVHIVLPNGLNHFVVLTKAKKEEVTLMDPMIGKKVLSKKDFMLPQEKMKIWRSLGWISCDNDRSRFTKKIRIGDKTFRKIVIEKEPYKTIKNIIMNVGTRVGT